MFASRLADAVTRAGSPLCVGIDPWADRLPRPGDPGHFGLAVVEAAAGRVAAVKPQFAFFERFGPDGMRALAEVCRAARAKGLLVVGDAKRGDIGSTATAYAEATLARHAPFPCDALTVNPLLGPDTLEPFARVARENDGGLFVLLRTSNPGSATWQEKIAPGIADWIGEHGAGAVVGATHGELRAWRARLPDTWFLVPGYGAQGATAADTRAAARADGLGALVNSSRAVTFPPRWDGDPAEQIAGLIDAAVAELRAAWT
ncbi:MAG: orotidine-5'-phosphate decarboxylase [Myxococcota bacterium]